MAAYVKYVWSTGDIITAARLNNLETQYDCVISVFRSNFFPVGSVYVNVVNTNPLTFLGFGTWSAFATGRTIVGYNSGIAEFDTAEETGGAKTVTLTTANLPVHTHAQNAHTHIQDSHNHTQDPHNHTIPNAGNLTTIGQTDLDVTVKNDDGGTITTVAATATNIATTATNQSTTATNQNTGGGGAHNNLQPFVIVFMWKRTA